MGYVEPLCQICGASFNIARVRRRDEPFSAAWAEYAGEGTFVEADEGGQLCRTGVEGCVMFDREKPERGFMALPKWGVVQEEERREGKGAGWEGDGSGGGGSEHRETVEADDLDFYDQENNKDDGQTLSRVADDDDRGEAKPADREEIARRDAEHCEHIAGPGCRNTSAYSGHRISPLEMRNVNTFQCLVHKKIIRGPFGPEHDDEEFERNGAWFLSGLQDHMPSLELMAELYPARHGVCEVQAQNQFSGDEDCMPFHPWCLEVYKRVVARQRGGDVDIAGLAHWYEHLETSGFDYEYVRAGQIGELQDQYWSHREGTEYIAANPLFVPKLAEVLQAAVSNDADFDVGRGAFDVLVEAVGQSSQDPFSSLPPELRLLVLGDLASVDIASLRLASRAFRQLPIFLWHSLVLKELPWIWEAWSEDHPLPYSFWSTVSERQLRSDLGVARSAMPVPNRLDTARTNWYGLYLSITRNWQHLKGLQNRKRIWSDCEEIVRRIGKYRANGDIPIRKSTGVASI